MPAKKAAKKPMSAAHKKALAEGRNLSRAVKAYLAALDAQSPKKRGRRRTPESIEKRLAVIEEQFGPAAPLKRLALAQEQVNLQAELDQLTAADTTDLDALEKDFIKAAKTYGQNKGITYAAWRAVGVSPATLKAAGISRGG